MRPLDTSDMVEAGQETVSPRAKGLFRRDPATPRAAIRFPSAPMMPRKSPST